MKIGDRVFVHRVAYPRYDNEDNRRWVERLLEKEGWYVGYTYKQEGKLHPATYSNDGGDPAFLGSIRPVKLLRIKLTERSNDVFAYPEQVSLINEKE